jgi:hypothetical protein
MLVSGHFFERLLTKFSVPEELFGPLSLRGLETDAYVRMTERCACCKLQKTVLTRGPGHSLRARAAA